MRPFWLDITSVRSNLEARKSTELSSSSSNTARPSPKIILHPRNFSSGLRIYVATLVSATKDVVSVATLVSATKDVGRVIIAKFAAQSRLLGCNFALH